ncbi:hypothetical protein IJG29_00590, partial [Candidatus Saccharibacteria bacterium]|nr:hypothetical protein [Candidatus Saccharibacteria bacterium]
AVIADSLTPGITYTAKDSRDDQDYTVAKLADGNVWMTKNLNLAGGTTVTPADTDVTSNYVLPANSTTGPTGFSKVANSGSTICFNGTEILPCYSYYDIYTATAGTGPADDAPSSICPSGWKLPTVGQVDSLRQKYSRAEMFSEPVSFLASAAYNSGPNRDMFDNDINTYPEACIWTRQGITNFWTRGNQNSFVISGADSASQGNAVRCVKDRSMQNFSATDAAAMSEGQTITLVDNRDGKEYEVTKINGRVWMTQNLAFTGTQLTPADSNVSENITMTYYSLDKNDDSYMDHCDETNGYNYACIKDSGSTETGVWYNSLAATANTTEGSVDSGDVDFDICPKNWHMPSENEFQQITSYNVLYSPVKGGYYQNGEKNTVTSGYWNSRTMYDRTFRYYLQFNRRGENELMVLSDSPKYDGTFVRCIAD